MAKVSEALGKRVYLDANIIIYVVEGLADYADNLRALLAAMDNAEIVSVTSELTLAETLVKPMRDGEARIQQAYKDFLRPTAAFEVVPISREILESAARLRATTSLKLPDAIHRATAQQHSCDSFLTNDSRFKSSGPANVKLLSEISLTNAP
jgi:predicted nucleic acid-binding protein